MQGSIEIHVNIAVVAISVSNLKYTKSEYNIGKVFMVLLFI